MIHATKLQEADAAAYARGVEQGTQAARAEAEQRCTFAIERILAALEALGQQLGAIEARLETEAVEVAVAVARKLMSSLVSLILVLSHLISNDGVWFATSGTITSVITPVIFFTSLSTAAILSSHIFHSFA